MRVYLQEVKGLKNMYTYVIKKEKHMLSLGNNRRGMAHKNDF